MNIAQIALLAIKQSTKNTELSQAHSNITKKQPAKPPRNFHNPTAGTQRVRPAQWREGRGQRREERGWQAPGPGLGEGARGSMRAPGRASAASCRHLAQLRAGRIFGGFTAPNGIHRWIRIRVVRNHLISTQASGSGLGAARGSTPRFGTQNSLPCIAWRSWRRGRVSPRF